MTGDHAHHRALPVEPAPGVVVEGLEHLHRDPTTELVAGFIDVGETTGVDQARLDDTVDAEVDSRIGS